MSGDDPDRATHVTETVSTLADMALELTGR
jgi:hypothetical protein